MRSVATQMSLCGEIYCIFDYEGIHHNVIVFRNLFTVDRRSMRGKFIG